MEVRYDEAGLASIIGQMIEQKLREKEKLVRNLRGSITIELTDFDSSATVYFTGDSVIVRNGGGGEALISTDFETLNKLATGEIGTLGALKLMLKRKLKIKGLGMAMKLQSLLT
ncbi:MAG: SCP2 sterol-binding domain-containing protein [Archaeoglobaceae archaeon]